ncbi:hypothetical protein KFL_004060010 [Klebsormidium nitens]|uniref:DDE-1 domain-containing protein n=1 Tax=Klebsormidium nitens TaxID=105231 RepID=A0A1Y1IHL0_KLENI|nr:hypothetical protein KFL_004060010 [Klebsormidium nitens]|eukprot:GAQ88167.1 hypothetical protein KFL_004060010 [Klebsormidium nitens]
MAAQVGAKRPVATITSFFKVATKEELEEQRKRDAVRSAERFAQAAAKREELERRRLAAKRPVGRPKKAKPEHLFVPQRTEEAPRANVPGVEGDATPEAAGGNGGGDGTQPPPAKKVRGFYTNWFVPDLWAPIAAAVKKHPRSLYDALNALQHIRVPGRSGSVYDKLTLGSMKTWFERDPVTNQFSLRERYAEAVRCSNAQKAARLAKEMEKPGGIFKGHPEVFRKLLAILTGMRDAGQPVDSSIIQSVIRGTIEALAPELLQRRLKGGQLFEVSRSFSRKFANRWLGWTWRRATTAASKLPDDWEQQGDDMAFRIAAICYKDNIPPELVVNSDQTGVHLRPSSDLTYEQKNVKEVKILGKEDKRQITCVVSSSAGGEVLPLQCVFEGKTSAVEPQGVEATIAKAKGFDLTHSANHWSNQETSMWFVERVLVPWHAKKCAELGRNALVQKMIWLVDCWKVHKSAEFLGNMAERFPLVKVLFVPANCTGKLQPADVVLQRPFKHRFRQQFNSWQAAEVAAQIEGGMGEIHDLAFQSRALSECLNRGLLAREQLEVDLGAGPEGDAEIIEQHEGAATMLQVMAECLEERDELEDMVLGEWQADWDEELDADAFELE